MTLGNHSNIFVAIPAHGPSDKLNRLLRVLMNSSEASRGDWHIIISNSGPPLNLSYPENFYTELRVPSDYFWTRAVASLFTEMKFRKVHDCVLMNHDCLIDSRTLRCLIARGRSLKDTAIHAVCLYLDEPKKIWFAGTKPGILFGHEWLYKNQRTLDLPKGLFDISSVMGQCLYLPSKAIDPKFLMFNQVPHYFGDSVMGVLMRKNGIRLVVDPEIIAYSDQSDQADKRSRFHCSSIQGIKTTWFSPGSPRNLRATFLGVLLESSHPTLGFVYASYMVLGRILVSLLEFCRLKRGYS